MHLLVVSHPCATPLNQQLFAELQAQTGWRLTLALPERWRDDYDRVRTAQAWPGFGGTLLPLPVVASGNGPLHIYRTDWRRRLRALRPDAVYVHHEPYAAATAQLRLASGSRRPPAFGFYSAQNILKRYPPPFAQTERWVFRRAGFAFPVSRSVLQVLRDKGYHGPATVLPLGIDSGLYRPSPERRRLRQSLGLDEATVLFGYVGRLVPEKGLFTLLRALRLLGGLSWRLLVIGDGPWRRTWERELAHAGLCEHVIQRGYVAHDAMPSWFSAMDVLVLPSESQPHWREQFGRVLIEALACGTPVIGSSCGEIPTVIEDTGGGLVFPEGDVLALARALLALAQDPQRRRALATAGRARVNRHYTLPVLARRMAEAIRNATQKD